MASEAQVAANQRNSKKSTGPRTAHGKARSAQNARTHGQRAAREKIMRDESLFSEERRMRWGSNTDVSNDIEEFLLHQNVALAATFERVQRGHLEHVRSRIRNADEIERDAAHTLGSRLFFDPGGPIELYGHQPVGKKKDRPSSNAGALPLERPDQLVGQLESTAAGCRWMLDRWTELRSFLEEPGGFWRGADRLKCLRLLGYHAVQVVDVRIVAEIFTASHALRPIDTPFADLRTDTGEVDLPTFVSDIRARWPDLVGKRKPEQARQLLLELVDENIERIEELLETHEQDPDENNERIMHRMGVDPSREGQFYLQYELKYANAVKKGVSDLQRYQEKKRKEAWRRERDIVPDMQPAAPRRAPAWPMALSPGPSKQPLSPIRPSVRKTARRLPPAPQA